MMFKQLSLLLLILLIFPVFVSLKATTEAQTSQTPGLYFGVDAAFVDFAQTEQLIDNVSSYTNLFIIGCEQQIGSNGGFGRYNETRLTLISQYVYTKGLNFIIYSDDPTYPSKQWMAKATENYGKQLLGIYYFDEPGGKQLDQVKYPPVINAKNFADASDKYVYMLNTFLRNSRYAIVNSFENPNQYKLYTSDYGLYWYDYAGGYDTVFAELGINSGNMNYSRQLSMAFCRGAATTFHKDWGAIITYGQTEYPYMEGKDQLETDMKWAYENGAKYIIVFDSNPNWTKSILRDDQLKAMKEFWQYAQSHPRPSNQPSDRSVYVLPENFGYSFRSPNDTVWGLWNSNWNGTNSLTFVADVSMCVVTYLQMFGPQLDIMYPTINGTQVSLIDLAALGYQHVMYWNDTALVQNMPSMPSQSPAISPYKQAVNPYDFGTVSPRGSVTFQFYLVATVAVIAVCIVVATFVYRTRRLMTPRNG